jgi:hypothetical protein
MQKITTWPAVFVRVDPEVYQAITAKAEERTLPASVIVREALNRAFKVPAKGAR